MSEAIARIVRQLALPVTNQHLADLALKADQDRRLALRLGNLARAAELDDESVALLELMK